MKIIRPKAKFLSSHRANTNRITAVTSPSTPHVVLVSLTTVACSGHTNLSLSFFNAVGGERHVMPVFTPFAQALALANEAHGQCQM